MSNSDGARAGSDSYPKRTTNLKIQGRARDNGSKCDQSEGGLLCCAILIHHIDAVFDTRRRLLKIIRLIDRPVGKASRPLYMPPQREVDLDFEGSADT